jgi:hypothetical protein
MTDGDLGNPHISFSEMWGFPKGRITGKQEVIPKKGLPTSASRSFCQLILRVRFPGSKVSERSIRMRVSAPF